MFFKARMRNPLLFSIAAALLSSAAAAHAVPAGSFAGLGIDPVSRMLSRPGFAGTVGAFVPGSWLAASGPLSGSLLGDGDCRSRGDWLDCLGPHAMAGEFHSGFQTPYGFQFEMAAESSQLVASPAAGHGKGPTVVLSEPKTYAMLLAGLALMGFVARRRQGSDQA